jgi:metal-dependent amidase/aminoacylase/carboxypeptidase family protein
MVNAIPEEVRLESYVRGSTFDAITDANKKVNRALVGAAYSIGTNIEIIDIPGYSPLINDKNMLNVAKEAFEAIDPDGSFVIDDAYSTGSTDMGDLSAIMPVVHPYAGGSRGKSHGNNYEIYDPEEACVKCAKWQLAMVDILLGNGAERAKQIVADYSRCLLQRMNILHISMRLTPTVTE